MKTQIEQIREATRAYIFDIGINRKSLTDRYQIYTDKGEGLECLWYHYDHTNKNEGLLPHQIKTEMTQYPYSHFALKGYGFNKERELGEMLRNINPNIEVLSMGKATHSPSRVSR